MDNLRTLIDVIVEAECKKTHSEHLVKTGIDLIVNEFIEHAHRETRLDELDGTLEEQISSAATELKKTLEAAYTDMYGRLNNGEFHPDKL
jgi:hypothetical protein